MIRRTYRSKKNTANALDHKDVLQTLDEKNSIFDAFYIQNIKQTKKELSCLGTSNQYYAPSTKIKKRKHVKKIVKEVDHAIRESIADSIYLTPEKSIHVNRPQDPFDLLFNSPNNEPDPPSNNKLVTNADKVNLKPVWEPKTYTRKKDPKKYNYSSSDTDSEKENSVKDISDKNVSDIRSYKLLIEKDLKQNEIDESICHIINKIPQLQKQNEMRNQPKHRLTNNLISSLSPSCSTPFKEKHRSYSIYKFSPICVKDSRNSSFNINGKANTVTNTENQIDFQHSPILQMSKTMKLNKSKHLQQLSPHIVTQKNDTISEMVEMCDNSQLDDVVENTPSNDTFNELHFKASESKPFLGFSQTSIKGTINKNIIKNVEADLTENSNIDLDIQSVIEQPDDISAIPEEVESFVNNVSYCTELEPFIGFSLKSSACLANQEKLPDKHSNDLESSNDISSQSSNTSHSHHIENNEVKETHLQSEDKSSNESAISSDYENAEQTCYDTCDSEESEEEPCKRVPEKLPLIQVERLQSSIFKKYYDVYKHTKNKETVEQNTSSDSDSSSSNSESCHTTKIEITKHNITVENKTNSQNIDSVVISSSEGDCVEPTSNDEDNCISFVTTRRRNEVANRSSLFMLEDTFASPSSSECDKTVLSINNNVTLSTHTQNDLDKYQQDLREVMQERKTRLQKRNSNLRQSVMTRKSSRILRESNIEPQEENKLDYSEVKAGIVLQPGKKWERSLSIYRRMTMTSDHFDHSLIIAEDEAFKGRKYRQSVINTMELQDQSLIHNVSISSRRSTFVSKPSRSSIRIVKKSNVSKVSLCESAVFDDIKDDTLLELSKLSIADSEREVTVLDQFNDSSRDFHESRGPTARDYVLRRCNQTDVIFFDECYPEIELKNCHKIGEGVYGEVFLWRARDGCARVMKIVPIAGTTKVNGENQKDFQEIIAEIVIAMELSALRTPLSEIELYLDEGKDIETLDLHSVGNATDVFNEIIAVRCVYGPYPSRLLDLWELYDEVKGSENDNPAVLPNDQQYIVLELANAGQDLEGYQFNNAEQAHALFWQVAFGLAVGEEAFQFEHRDLHWGNVLIAPTDQKSATFVLRGQVYRIPRCGVAATIIDYSLSRLSLQLYKCESAALFNDLATDEALFDAVGDYQFEVYRRMRDKLGNEWKNYEPYTNILWLHYTVDKMITALRYKRTNTKVHKHYIAKLKGIKNRILEYGSATQFVLTDNEN